MRAVVQVLVTVAVLLFVAAAILMVVAIADGTFGRTGSTARLGVGLSLMSVPFTLAALMLGRRTSRAPGREDNDTGGVSGSPPR